MCKYVGACFGVFVGVRVTGMCLVRCEFVFSEIEWE